ncbi:BadF/BadG/BcrA/BcrD ATPase family protein [Streptomyces sp. SPB162]|uniref:N-acetylglucosamine kinase n=1 Tax=Streptomyces sp. SPB162 TaxID=2940560 RepID=UPI002405449F|nr:BadF/BadG/BcrA/BcrD ATPase family protein [Streptomyces sp. SPB162]MDF9812536.1 glucosamine kinase [Streptomyces sp. SPB162]
MNEIHNRSASGDHGLRSVPGGRSLVVGIDAGGTRIRAYLADAVGVIGEGAGGPGNAMSVPRAELTRNLTAALGAAVPVDLRGSVVAVLGGFAGAALDTGPDTGHDLARSCLGAALAATGMGAGRVAVRGDIEIAFASAPGMPADGLLLIAGTGAAAARITGRRQELTVDGDGWLLGDEGGGFWLGREAVRAALRALSGRGPWTSLVDAVAAHYLAPGGDMPGRAVPVDRADPRRPGRLRELIVPLVYAQPPVRLAALSPLVVAADRTGDEVAGALLDAAAAELGSTVAALRPEAGEPLVVTGGLLAPAGPLLGRLAERAEAMGLRVVPVRDGGAGAVALARLLT